MSTEKEVVLTENAEQDPENESGHVVKSKAAVHPESGHVVKSKAAVHPGAGASGNDNQVQRRESTKVKPLVRHGHLRVGEDGLKTYKKTPASAIMAAIQLGIGYSVGRLSAKPERDVLMIDFSFTEKVWFPGSGSRETPSHKFEDFRFKSYAPVAFRYFRDIFAIQPSGFLMSLSNEQLRELSNPGASGSLFFLSNDDNFIVKTVQHKEATFLQQLLPGYYMNLHQNPRTLLPKFFGLYCYQSGSTNIRLAVMNNLLPSTYKCHQKYDLKGSTFKRRASKAELDKKSPTRKDLDFLSDHPEGILLEPDTYNAVMKTIRKDVRVLESFKIMDYSLLLGIHNVDQAAKDREQSTRSSSHSLSRGQESGMSLRRDGVGAALEAIQLTETEDERPVGGIPARNAKGERLILFIGVIDILQSYRMAKKLEHGWKSIFHDGDTVSVHKPSFYAKRFLDFVRSKVLTRSQVSRGPSKRKTISRGQASSAPASGRARISSTMEGTSDNIKGERTGVVVRIDESKNGGDVTKSEHHEQRTPADTSQAAGATAIVEDRHASATSSDDEHSDHSTEAGATLPSDDHVDGVGDLTVNETVIVGSQPTNEASDGNDSEHSSNDDETPKSITTRFSDVIVTVHGDEDEANGNEMPRKYSNASTVEDRHDTNAASHTSGSSHSSRRGSSSDEHVTTAADRLPPDAVTTTETIVMTTTDADARQKLAADESTTVTTSHVTITTYTQDGEVVSEETHVTSSDEAQLEGKNGATFKLSSPVQFELSGIKSDGIQDTNVVTTIVETTSTTEESTS